MHAVILSGVEGSRDITEGSASGLLGPFGFAQGRLSLGMMSVGLALSILKRWAHKFVVA